MTAFEEMGVLPEIGKAVDELGWLLPTDVQAEAIPAVLGGGDVLMAAETGSGKTGAFCLPIIQIVWETIKDIQSGKCGKSSNSKTSDTGGKASMSFFDRGPALAVSPDGLTCQSREQKSWHGCRATKGVRNKGKYYFEATVTDEGLCRIGWSTPAATLELGVDKEGFGFGGTGKKSSGKQFDDYGEPFGMHDVIGCLLDLDNFSIRFSKNGVDLGEAYRVPDRLNRSSFFPAVLLKNAEMKFNFGDSDFKFPPGMGFVGLPQAPSECSVANNVSGVSVASRSSNVMNSTQAIVIEPSRELAEQTYQQIQKFKRDLKDPKIRDLLVIGGVSAKEQISVLHNGVDIVVGTPGRLEDLISTGELSLSAVRFFVLDEADGLLQHGYEKMITKIHQQIPKFTNDGKRLQMVICSATLHSFEVKKLANKIMHFPTWIDLKGQDSVPETVHHVVCLVNPKQDSLWKQLGKHIITDGVHSKDNLGSSASDLAHSEAVKILKGEYVIRAITEHNMDQALIFCRTKVDCDNLERYMGQISGGNKRSSQLSCVCLHSDRSPPERKANLLKFKKGEVKFLVCTDVAARGIDITGVPYVINVTLPDEKANYIHRIGRVGRAERMGLALSLVSTVPEKVWYHSNCTNRGKNCWNTDLTDRGGCCIWYNEPQYLSDIEEHLGVTIQQIETEMKVSSDEFDGKVVYGEKRKAIGSGYENHVSIMQSVVKDLAKLEEDAQTMFLKRHYLKDKTFFA